MNKKRKIMSLFVVGVLIATTIGNIVAEKQNTYARNPSIQNSKYYMLEFSIESNAEKAFLVLDGEKHEMFNKDGRYICRTSFKEGDHAYYFEFDNKRLPEKGSYRVTEVERRWILLNSLIDHLTWKPNKEQTLLTKKQELYQTWIIRSEAAASISGLTKRMAVTSIKIPQNFDTSQIMKSLKATDLGKRGTFDITKSAGLLDLSQASYTFALELAKRTEIVSTGLDNIERITIQNIEELARNYGCKSESVLKQEEAEGYSVAGLYTSKGIQLMNDVEFEGHHYYLRVGAYWGKSGFFTMDYELYEHAYVRDPMYDVDAIGLWSSSVAGQPVFPAAYKGDNNKTDIYHYRKSSYFSPLRQFLTTVVVTGEFNDAQELSTTLQLNLDFEMGY